MGLTHKKKIQIAVLLSGALLAVLNMTLLSPALPHIMNDMQVDATTVQWLTSGYALVEACVIPMNAYLVGRFSTRKLFIAGIAWFACGSAVAAMSPVFIVLFLGRVMQAMATGVVMPMVFTLILLVFPREKRGTAMGVIGLIIAFAPAIGPSLSGVLVDSVGWRALFVIVSTLAVIVVLLALFACENLGEFNRAPFDLLSVLFMLPGMICLLYGLSSFTSEDNLTFSLLLAFVGAMLLVIFVRRQLSLEEPMLRVQVLKARPFRSAVILIALLQAALVGSEVVMPMYVQNVLGNTATTSGFVMLPGAIIGAFVGFVAGRLFDRWGVRPLVVTGACGIVLGGILLVLYRMDTSILIVCLVYSVMAIGVQALVTPLNTWGVNSLENSVLQHGNSLSATTNQVGGSFGTALIVSLTGLSSVLAPGADTLTQTYAGVHAAFVGMCVMLCMVAAGIFIFVRDKAPAGAAFTPARQRDALEGVLGVNRRWYVADVMNPHSPFLRVGANVRDAIECLQKNDTAGLPILNSDDKVCGFVSDGDILKYLSKQSGFYTDGTNYFRMIESEDFSERLHKLLDLDVMCIATKRVIAVKFDDEAEDAFKLLSERRIKKVPVLSEDKFVGALSRRNIISVLATIVETQFSAR